MGATKIMIIRHAERPDVYENTKYFGVDPIGATAGKDGKKHLVTLGWQRAGALTTLFTEPWGPKPGLAVPRHLIASNPVGDEAGFEPNAGPSQRPYETLSAISAKLDIEINKGFAKDDYAAMTKFALDLPGIVLISWQHEDIPLENKAGEPGLSGCILEQTGTHGNLGAPRRWPQSDEVARYDLVWVFDRPTGEGPIRSFNLVAQFLLAGDQSAPALG